ncbi:RNA-guided endonuclease TnpB family protein (plasmid) [Macrococcus psychrotolerans]|uniref:RNA-guided endonuclease TnpB family protein n=1 Tax=Macrococcus psychrotolerans TaxID=3039389 RepID=A0AAT9P7E9_9STAP|nr:MULTISPECIES: RNA-guided endonuclease TnpB family protein [Macrococcus]QYA34066.1 transposase [Macrococcus sp. 19Msa1099]QYA38851.1 transposase [Macrococcus caseolyticus]QYA77574.1 transposase [Macrococcus caseolyticus]
MRAYKTEIKPNKAQIELINQTIGVTRYVYNLFITKNQNRYKRNLSFMSGYDFSKWVNNRHSKEKQWIKNVPSKAVKQTIMNAEDSYRKFFKGHSSYPKHKKKSLNGAFYLIGTIKVERHRIFLPKLKWIQLKEFGYIPKSNIKSATISRKGSHYFVSVLVDEPFTVNVRNQKSEPIGLDLGLKETVYSSNGEKLMSLYRNKQLIKLNKSLKRQQRKLSRKQKGSNNRYKQLLKINRLYQRISNIKTDMKRKLISTIIKANPRYITIENLNIKGMMKNRRLSNALQQTGLGYVVEWLKHKSKQHDIELRQVDRFYPSSQLCSCCKHRQKMPLNKRTFYCENCGNEIDRDWNASLNLVKAEDYVVLT